MSESLPTGRRGARSEAIGQALLGWLFLAPAALFILAFLAIPVGLAVGMAFMRIDLTRSSDWTFFGVGNFGQIGNDQLVWPAILRTVEFGIIVVCLTTVSALGIALLLNERMPGMRALRVVVLVPWAIAPLAAGVSWQLVFNFTYGGLNTLLMALGIIHTPVAWLSDAALAYVAIIVGQVWLSIPFASLILLARLQGVPPWLYSAAKMDGAGRWARLRHVTLPLLRNTLLIVVLVELILAFQTFDLVYALTSGGPAFSTLVLSMLIYHRSFADLRIGYGSALAMVLTAVVAFASIAIVLIARGRRPDAA